MKAAPQLISGILGIAALVIGFTLLWEAGKFVRRMVMKFIDLSWNWIGDHPGWGAVIIFVIIGAVFCRDDK